MLFPLSANTPQSEVFRVLNNELLYFLQASLSVDTFCEELFSEYSLGGDEVRSACWTNEPTRNKFEALWKVLPSDHDAKQELFDLVNNSQDIASIFNDASAALPELQGEKLLNKFKSLTSHMFISSKDLSGIKRQACSSIEQHFQDYRSANHSTQLCFLCGTACLSQDRAGEEADDQWRADYDHILCKDKYPIYSAHPGNFIPTCHVCNSKAKGARNLLVCASNNRRTAFYPLPPATDSCHEYASVKLAFRTLRQLVNDEWQDPVSSIAVSFSGAPADVFPKIVVWEEVYQVPKRVEAHIVTNLCIRIISDLMPNDFYDFLYRLNQRATSIPLDCKMTEWRFWWQKVYEHLNSQDCEVLDDVWSLIQWKTVESNDSDMRVTFGI